MSAHAGSGYKYRPTLSMGRIIGGVLGLMLWFHVHGEIQKTEQPEITLEDFIKE